MIFRRNSKKKSNEPVYKLIKALSSIWLSCIFGVVLLIFYVIVIRHQLFNEVPNIFTFTLFALVFLGTLSFLVLFPVSAFKKITGSYLDSLKEKSKIRKIFNVLITLLLLPLFLLYRIISPRKKEKAKSKIKKLGSLFRKLTGATLVLLVIFPIWIGSYALAGTMVINMLGYSTEPISVSGTGSMYPTFPKGEGRDPKELAKQIVDTPGMIRYPNGLLIGDKRFLNYEISRGDIVVIENDKIREISENTYGKPSGWIKRVIGMPGDTIELRGGIVYLNSEPLNEPYTAKARSTFGESFLDECSIITVPEENIFVMGDNRKGSGDSREIGFVELSAVNHVLPLDEQEGTLDKFWRDTSNDFSEASKIKLDKNRYLDLINEKRLEAGVEKLEYEPKLELSAIKRGQKILEFNDFSFEATQSGYTMAQAINDVGYYNIIWGESSKQGYYDAEELIDNQFQFPKSKNFLLEADYQEIGIAEVEGEINDCPTQVVVIHMAGYVPPNYSQADIDSWKASLSRLEEIQPGWASLKNAGNFYENNKTDINRINEIISIRIANIKAVISRMEANQWLTSSEENMIDQDKVLYNEQEIIAERLNNL